MTHFRLFGDRVLALLAVGAASLSLGSCGGSPSAAPATPVPPTPTPVSISPATATLYSGLPTTFTVTGGTGPYTVTSSDQAAVPIAAATTTGTFVVLPASVAADTNVTLTVRDTLNTQASATLVVKPLTVSNIVTITPTSSQAAACGAAICSGGDAEVKVTLSQGGVPVTNRDVQFSVVSGDFRIITSSAGMGETLALQGIARTDSTGTARIRIRVLSDAPAQTALLDITDLTTGGFQRTSFTVAPSSNAPLNAQPSTLSFRGSSDTTCAGAGTPLSADVIVFGGRPPYNISQPGSFQISPLVVSQSGGRFTVTANGQCTTGSTIAIVDSAGSTVSVVATNSVGPPGAATANFVVAPLNVALDNCAQSANVTIAGGRGPGNYFANSGNSAITVTVGNNVATIRRTPNTSITATSVPVSISDGQSVQTVNVALSGQASATTCP